MYCYSYVLLRIPGGLAVDICAALLQQCPRFGNDIKVRRVLWCVIRCGCYCGCCCYVAAATVPSLVSSPPQQQRYIPFSRVMGCVLDIVTPRHCRVYARAWRGASLARALLAPRAEGRAPPLAGSPYMNAVHLSPFNRGFPSYGMAFSPPMFVCVTLLQRTRVSLSVAGPLWRTREWTLHLTSYRYLSFLFVVFSCHLLSSPLFFSLSLLLIVVAQIRGTHSSLPSSPLRFVPP